MNVSARQYLRWALDPVLFVQEAHGIDPDPWQKDALRSTEATSLYNCCRQSGKSTTVGWDVEHGAIFFEETTSILVAPTERQSKNLIDKVLSNFDELQITLVEKTKLSCTLENGSKIIALPGDGDNIRGYTAHKVVIDEFAFIAPNANIVQAVSPMLMTTRGKLKAMSTPNGKIGPFHEWWHDREAKYRRFLVTAKDCPRVTAEFLAEERRRLANEALFRQEYYCEFRDTVDSIFLSEDTRAAVDEDIEPLYQDVWKAG